MSGNSSPLNQHQGALTFGVLTGTENVIAAGYYDGHVKGITVGIGDHLSSGFASRVRIGGIQLIFLGKSIVLAWQVSSVYLVSRDVDKPYHCPSLACCFQKDMGPCDVAQSERERVN